MSRKGFTLIELLVVIAIIGVLSAVVIASLNNSRIRANDARVKSELSNIRGAAELYYGSPAANFTYGQVVFGDEVGGSCEVSPSMFTSVLLDPILSAMPSGTSLRCTSDSNNYQISASLANNPSGNPDFWCVNNKGVSKIIEGTTHLNAHPNGDSDCIP